jgi:pimeloyl-ACP methyl ester carboxylesterase
MLPLKELPPPSLTLVGRPEHDREYRHFEGASEVPFDPRAFGFSQRNAWWLADSALLSYWPPDEAPHIFHDAGGLEGEFIEDSGTECYVAWNDTAAIVAFRGTQPNQPLDVWSDIDFPLVDWIESGERVHEGFRDALSHSVVERLLARLNALPNRSVWLTGHSLGAALATLFADRFPSFAGLYTFGSPRVGDPAFALGFNQRHAGRSFRYVNHRDVVTQVPAMEMFGARYAHVDRELHINGDGRIVEVAASGATPESGQVEDNTPATVALVGPVIDHTPRRYAVLVWNAVAGAMAPAGPGQL